jgi:hypothetical protein
MQHDAALRRIYAPPTKTQAQERGFRMRGAHTGPPKSAGLPVGPVSPPRWVSDPLIDKMGAKCEKNSSSDREGPGMNIEKAASKTLEVARAAEIARDKLVEPGGTAP